jgi:hypothetical protein
LSWNLAPDTLFPRPRKNRGGFFVLAPDYRFFFRDPAKKHSTSAIHNKKLGISFRCQIQVFFRTEQIGICREYLRFQPTPIHTMSRNSSNNNTITGVKRKGVYSPKVRSKRTKTDLWEGLLFIDPDRKRNTKYDFLLFFSPLPLFFPLWFLFFVRVLIFCRLGNTPPPITGWSTPSSPTLPFCWISCPSPY